MKPSLTLLLIFIFAAGSTPGQKAEPDPNACNSEFAKFIVDQQVVEGRSVAETDKRIRILIRAADFLWNSDRSKGREYFTEAYKTASERFAEKGFEKTAGSGFTTLKPDYRFEVIRAIAKRDGRWARKLTEELLQEYKRSAADRPQIDKNREIDSIMSIAIENVVTNPELSWYLFRRLFQETIDHQWYWTLYGVAAKDRAFADALYIELLQKLANSSPRRLNFLSAYPFGRDRIFGFEKMQYGTSLPEDFVPNENFQAKFIDTFLRRADSFASDPSNFNQAPEQYRQPEAVYLVSVLGELEPIIVQKFPFFLSRLAVARSKAFSMLSEENKKDLENRDKSNSAQSRSFEDRISELESANEKGLLKDSMILSVLISGLKTEEEFRILEPWLEKVSDADARIQMSNYYWFLRSMLAIDEKRLDDAQRFAEKVPELDHQAILKFKLAEKQLGDINDSASTYQTLLDVSKAARRSDDSVGKARVQLGLANLYEKFNHSFAISELSDAVITINHIKDEDLLASNIYRKIQTKDMSFYASFGVPGFGLEETFTNVSRDDFSLSLSNAKALDDRFYRTIAVIAIARNCIDRPVMNTPKR